jgi:Protein kinase domain
MTSERWRRITSIFHAALARKTGERTAFVAARAGADSGVHHDVAAMLSAHADLARAGGTAAVAARLARDAVGAETLTVLPAAADSGPREHEPLGWRRPESVANTDGSARDAAAAPQLLLTPASLVAGRYRVVGLIGRGGMGEVYEARDEVADDVVALKVARSGPEPVGELAARWRRELMLARKVSHGGVCRVHDVAIHREGDRDLLLLSMERVHGESLRARLAREPMLVDEALAIARQVAQALEAAHGAGVLHRDVKPENILLEPAGRGGLRAVLTDFGIARDVTGLHSLTETGRVAGTPGYLAPEVLRGAAPTPKSDLYAFAVVVRALVDKTPASLTSRALAVFERALSAEWATRYDSPVQFVDDLASALQTPQSASAGRWTRRRVLAAAAVLATVVGSSVAFLAYRGDATAIAPASQVLVTDVVNGTNDRELDGAGEVLRSQLAQSTHFELLPTDRIRAVLALMGRGAGSGIDSPETAREVAMREGAPLVVYATLTQLGADYTLNVKLEQVGPRPSFARGSRTQSFAAPTKAGLFEAMHGAAVWIRRTAGELPADLDAQDRAATETTTSSWEALRLFTQAGGLQAAGRVLDATLLLEQAVRIDPDFAMAHARLGDYLMSLRRDKEGYAAWERAIAAADRRQLTSREALRIRGQYLDDTGDLAAAEAAYRAYAVHYPNDFYAAFFLGTSLRELDRGEEAVPWLEKAVALRPTWNVGAVHLAISYLDLGRASDTAQAIDRVAALGAAEWATWLRALSLFTAVRLDEALAALEPLRASSDPQWRSRAHTVRASWLSEVGRDEEALSELHAGIDHDTTLGLRDRLADKWLLLADLQRRFQDPEVRTSVQRALETATNARRLETAVGILVQAGYRGEAERLMARFEELPALPLTGAARDRASGELELAAGDAAGAVAAFERALPNTRRRDRSLAFPEALARAGDHGPAERVLRAIADRPTAIYSGLDSYRPGLWRQALTQLMALVERRDSAAAGEIRTRFAGLVLTPASPMR